MASKIAAILQRKTKDYYDLFWLIDRGVKPNFKRLFDLTFLKTKKEIAGSLLARVNQAIEKKDILRDDLYPFFKSHKFVDNFVDNIDTLPLKIKSIF